MASSSSLIDTLTASGGSEPAGRASTLEQSLYLTDTGFLNDIVDQLWPNITVAGAKILKDAVEPVLKSTLPGPLANLQFVKIDLGHEPLRLSNVDVHKTSNEGIKLDLDVEWNSACDIELDASHVPKIVC